MKKQVFYLDQDPFTQLYVAVGRDHHSSDLMIMAADSSQISSDGVPVRNVVFPELLNSTQAGAFRASRPIAKQPVTGMGPTTANISAPRLTQQCLANRVLKIAVLQFLAET